MPRSANAPALSAACTCGRLRRAARALTQRYDDAMAPAGLRVTQFSLLRTLARGGPARISELAAQQLLDRTALSRNLDPLLEQALVAVAPGRDARTREVELTAKGAATLRRAENYWKEAQEEVARRIGKTRLAQLIAILGDLETLHPDREAGQSPKLVKAAATTDLR
ncbi:MAG TPA: MarR family winged helix-turn-helix transcriptional regulator [Casimicrobiaceae bacterium]